MVREFFLPGERITKNVNEIWRIRTHEKLQNIRNSLMFFVLRGKFVCAKFFARPAGFEPATL